MDVSSWLNQHQLRSSESHTSIEARDERCKTARILNDLNHKLSIFDGVDTQEPEEDAEAYADYVGLRTACNL